MTHEANTTVSQAVEVGYQLLHAAPVLHTDVENVLPRSIDAVIHHRDSVSLKYFYPLRVHLGNNGRQTRHPLPEHHPHAGGQARRTVICVGNDYFIPGIARCAFERPVNIPKEGIPEVRDNDAYAAALARD